ncbi:non-structural protein 1 [Fenneropenaeus chinensis hepandensovirus]|uniref:Non-structural protein 1 n=1 Tax=Fenneropenaeus chinensis hepandensovirus TaxID=797418 RepID=E2E2D0_9VIRU|nr:non-structural protein 1 [Fenneropenaeus chinensis hepandensovirus]ADK63426.1 non-structural protein 1 [Fenneropenaeus chinensis hepandensovirus]
MFRQVMKLKREGMVDHNPLVTFYSGIIVKFEHWNNNVSKVRKFLYKFAQWLYKECTYIHNISAAVHDRCKDDCCKDSANKVCKNIYGPHLHILLESVNENWSKSSKRVLFRGYEKILQHENKQLWEDLGLQKTSPPSMSLWDGEMFKWYMFRDRKYAKVHGTYYYSSNEELLSKLVKMKDTQERDDLYEKACQFKKDKNAARKIENSTAKTLDGADSDNIRLSSSRAIYLENLQVLEKYLVKHKCYTIQDFKMMQRNEDEIWVNYMYDIQNLEKVIEKLNIMEYSLQQADYIEGNTWIGEDLWNTNSAYMRTVKRGTDRYYWYIQRHVSNRASLIGQSRQICIDGAYMMFNIIDNMRVESRPKTIPIISKNKTVQWIQDFMDIIHGNLPKINCMMLYGNSNSGKTQLIEALTGLVNTAIMTNVGDGGTFHFSNITEMSTIVVGNETKIRTQTIEQWKGLCGGENVTMPMKYKEHKTHMFRKPVFLTNQHHPLVDISHYDDRRAIENRSFMYKVELGSEPVNAHIKFPNRMIPIKKNPELTQFVLASMQYVHTNYMNRPDKKFKIGFFNKLYDALFENS